MGVSTAGLIGAAAAIALVIVAYVSPRAAFRQRLAQPDPAESEKQRDLIRWGYAHWQGPLGSSWVQLPARIIAAAFAGYLVGRLFD